MKNKLGIRIISGIEPGWWELDGDVLTNLKIRINLLKFKSISVIGEEVSESQQITRKEPIGRVAGGILGYGLLGPAGAVLGTLMGGNKNSSNNAPVISILKTINCELLDGRTFIAIGNSTAVAELSRLVAINQAGNKQIANVSKDQDTDNMDRIECPRCAEWIKKKASICRFCGFEINQISITNVPKIELSQNESEEFKSLILHFKNSSKKNSLQDDSKIIKVVKRLIAYSKESQIHIPEGRTFSVDSEKINISKEENISIRELNILCEKILYINILFEMYENHVAKFSRERLNKNELSFAYKTCASIWEQHNKLEGRVDIPRISSALTNEFDKIYENNTLRDFLVNLSGSGFTRRRFFYIDNCLFMPGGR